MNECAIPVTLSKLVDASVTGLVGEPASGAVDGIAVSVAVCMSAQKALFTIHLSSKLYILLKLKHISNSYYFDNYSALNLESK